jgi:anthranilate synthase/aminodeoxychorismate synthase-like glutamine amidotransferase
LQVVRELWATTPILGVCLGHQAIAEGLGGEVVRAREPMHGRTSEVFHDGRGIFQGAPNPLVACRYHSLVVKESSLPALLEVSARSGDGEVMALRVRDRPVVGVQFHPESILTVYGYSLLAAFLKIAAAPVGDVPDIKEEWETPVAQAARLPNAPVTF